MSYRQTAPEPRLVWAEVAEELGPEKTPHSAEQWAVPELGLEPESSTSEQEETAWVDRGEVNLVWATASGGRPDPRRAHQEIHRELPLPPGQRMYQLRP